MKALILEDNFPLAQLLKEILTKKGWETYLSCSWREASKLIDKHEFDFLILDILLPDKKGLEILDILSSNQKIHSLKILLISAFIEESAIIEKIPKTLKNNCSFLKKPIDEKILLSFIEELKKTDSTEISYSQSFFEKSPPSHSLNLYFPFDQTFDSKELIPCVFLAHLKQFNGEIEAIADNNEDKILIQFNNGNIVRLTSNSKKSFFGTLLVEHGLSIQEDIEIFLENKNSNKMIGEKLVDEGLLNPYMLNLMLKEQIKVRLSEIMSHPSLKLNIKEKALENNNEIPYLEFNESDFIEWLSDSVQTELKDDFLNCFYTEIKSDTIEKSSKINKAVVYQREFVQKYNSLFQELNTNSTVESFVSKSNNKNQTLQLLYFGLLTKSLYLKNKNPSAKNFEKIDMFLDNIIQKYPEDLFAVLKLPWNASPADIEKNYKQLILKIHPDSLPPDTPQNIKEKIEKTFHIVTQSYETLKNEEKRKEYIRVHKEENFITVMDKYEEGLTQIKNGNFQKGLESLSQIANHKHSPSNLILYILWSKLKMAGDSLQNNRKEAATIRKIVDSCPISLRTSTLFWYVKGLFCMYTAQYERAEELFQKSLTVQKDFLEAKKELIIVKQKIKKNKVKAQKNIFNFIFKKSG